MDGGHRVEAERWLAIAEKLLTAQDFAGARNFSIRARDSDPRLMEFADQVIAVADTLTVAGDNRRDYYAILQLPRFTQSMELVATQYRKLALLLNTSRNRLSYADHAFKLVSEAWMVFSNPSKKAMYDQEVQMSQFGHFGQIGQLRQPGQLGQFPPGQETIQSPPPQHHHQPVVQVREPTPVRKSFRNGSGGDENGITTQQFIPVSARLSRPSAQQRVSESAHNRYILQPRVPESGSSRLQTQSKAPEPTASRPSMQQKAPEPSPTRLSMQPKAPEPTPTGTLTQQRTPETAKPVSQASGSEATRPLRSTTTHNGTETDQPRVPSIWTACPYCYYMYEYPKEYEDFALKCQNCKRAFHAAAVPAPPITGDNKDMYFCCWGFFPLGFSGKEKNKSGLGSRWSPFSAMFATPMQADGKKPRTRSAESKVAYKDDSFSESDADDSDSDSDDEWDRPKKKSKYTKGKGKGVAYKNVKKSQNERGKKAVGENVDSEGGSGSARGGNVHEDGVVAGRGEGSSSGRKRAAKALGKLDLNVMFSNEVEEAATGGSVGNRGGAGHNGGVEDNIEGIAFFEGLDEFLSTLPILQAVGGDDKVKAS